MPVNADAGPASISEVESPSAQMTIRAKNVFNYIASVATGIFYTGSLIKMADVTDGASNTYLLGEKYLDPESRRDRPGRRRQRVRAIRGTTQTTRAMRTRTTAPPYPTRPAMPLVRFSAVCIWPAFRWPSATVRSTCSTTRSTSKSPPPCQPQGRSADRRKEAVGVPELVTHFEHLAVT